MSTKEEKPVDLNLAVIGNCSYSALIDKTGAVVWMCLPRFDSDPVFCTLLRKNKDLGFFDVGLENFHSSTQTYIDNTAVLVTTLSDKKGKQAIEITDFAPRFEHFGRTFKPNMLLRRIRPIKGHPRIKIRVRPTFGYGWGSPEITRGSNHVRYVLPSTTLRLTTNAPVLYIIDEVPFVVEEDIYLIFMSDESLTESVEDVYEAFLKRTIKFWHRFVRRVSIPFDFQEEVIRATIALKLCSYEETGAIISAMTTSIPKGPFSNENTDSRYCWLRDSYFTVNCLNRLGTTGTMEDFLRYITNIIAEASSKFPSSAATPVPTTPKLSAAPYYSSANSPSTTSSSAITNRLQPVYGIGLETKLHEKVMHRMPGYRGMGPVKIGNDYYKREEHDTSAILVLACTQVFFDKRLRAAGDLELFKHLEDLGQDAITLFDKASIGAWGMKEKKIYTTVSVVCWAACDHLEKIAKKLEKPERQMYWHTAAQELKSTIMKRAFNQELNSFVTAFDSDEVDASLLSLPQFNFIDPMDQRFINTVNLIEKKCKVGKWITLSPLKEGERVDQVRIIWTLWYIQALAAIGRKSEALELFKNVLAHRNHVGLLSETIDVNTGELWGNFPQVSTTTTNNCRNKHNRSS
eukprot:GEZU01025429.1.p1 GENE.GEZU01025429.1~~GEZU01025429.1.p1  ORF type:complete len:631 (-),score=142.81 GEZU01025429.1:205-2097(-)